MPTRTQTLFINEPLLLDVLARLSPRTLARAKLVCRQWNDAARGALTLRAIARVDAAADRYAKGCLLGPEAVYKGLHPVVLREVCDGSLCRYLGWRLGWYGLEDVDDNGLGVQSAAGWGGGGLASGSSTGININTSNDSAGGRLIFGIERGDSENGQAPVVIDLSSSSSSSHTDDGSARLLTFPLPAPLSDDKSWKQRYGHFSPSPQGRLVATWHAMERATSAFPTPPIHFLSINDGRTGAPLLCVELGGSLSRCEEVYWSRCGCFLAMVSIAETLCLIDLASSFLGRGAWSGVRGGNSSGGGAAAASEPPSPPRATLVTNLLSLCPNVVWSAPSSARLYLTGDDGAAQWWEACSQPEDGGRLRWADCRFLTAGGVISDGQPLRPPGTTADDTSPTAPFFRAPFDKQAKGRTTAALLHPGVPLYDRHDDGQAVRAVILRDDVRSRNALFGPGVAYDAATLSERLVLPLQNSLVAWLWRRQRRLARLEAQQDDKGGDDAEDDASDAGDDAAAVLGPILRYDPDEGDTYPADEVHQLLLLDAARPVDALRACVEKGWSKQRQENGDGGQPSGAGTPPSGEDDDDNSARASANVTALLPWVRAHEDLLRRAILRNTINLQRQLEAAVRGALGRLAPGVAFSSAAVRAAVTAPTAAPAAPPQKPTSFFSTALGSTYHCTELAVRPQGGLVAFVCSASGRLYLRATAPLGSQQPHSPPPTLQIYPPPNRATPPLAQGPAGPGVIVPSIPWRGRRTDPWALLGQWSPCGRRLLFFGRVGVSGGSNDKIRVPMVLELSPGCGSALPTRLRLLVFQRIVISFSCTAALAWSPDARSFCVAADVDSATGAILGKPSEGGATRNAVRGAVVVRLPDDGGKGFWEGELEGGSSGSSGGSQWSLF